MLLKIINTTDGKYIGELVNRESGKLFEAGEVIIYKDTEFSIDRIIVNGKIIKLICSNYIVELEIMG